MLVRAKQLKLLLTISSIIYLTKSDCSGTLASNCDTSCVTCYEYLNPNTCCSCPSSQYLLQSGGNSICVQHCPPSTFEDIGSGQCIDCNLLCLQCTSTSSTQCTECVPSAYHIGATTTCITPRTSADNAGTGYEHNPCPPPYYGNSPTKQCIRCPPECSSCAIALWNQLPPPVDIGGYSWGDDCADGFCAYALNCYSCESGYDLVAGHCVQSTRCKTYAFQPSCSCKEGYYLNGASSCGLCHHTCLTCNGPSDSNCQTCYVGFEINAGKCQGNTTYQSITSADGSFGSQWTITSTGHTSGPVDPSLTNCPSTIYPPGYYGYSNSLVSHSSISTLSLSLPNPLPPHYLIALTSTLLFIDVWANGLAIIFKEGGHTVKEVHYQMNNVIGENICGINQYDHRLTISASFSHQDPNLNLQITNVQVGKQWGVQRITIGILKCHQQCLTCQGPLENQCLSCDVGKVLVLGKCLCDIDNGYFLEAGDCTIGCPSGKYKDKIKRSCVTQCDTTPIHFYHYQDECVQQCPEPTNQMVQNYTCVASCYSPTQPNMLLNFYRYKPQPSSPGTCLSSCPQGFYGDPLSGNCLLQCPADTYGYQRHCVENCPIDFFVIQAERKCVDACPLPYYSNERSNGVKVCELVCGDSLGINLVHNAPAHQCVSICPPDLYIDDDQCVSFCNNSAWKQSLPIPTCVSTCQGVTYANIQTGMCVEKQNCPSQTFADPSTKRCEQACSLGLHFANPLTKQCTEICTSNYFKQNSSKMCVEKCPPNQYGDSSTLYCVSVCPTSQFADSQTNLCVSTCPSTPISTFGSLGTCVSICPDGTYADINQARICTSSCLWIEGGIQTYGLDTTKTCVEQCPSPLYAIVTDDGIPKCVSTCTSISRTLYSDSRINKCVQNCQQPLYGSSTLLQCVETCPQSYFSQNVTSTGQLTPERICVTNCIFGWSDPISKSCTLQPNGCGDNLYAHENNHQCVQALGCDGFADPVTKMCTSDCYENQTYVSFGQDSNKMCVQVCSSHQDLYGDLIAGICVSSCDRLGEVRDPQSMRRCVTSCSRLPIPLFADQDSDMCVSTCPSPKLADNSSNTCVSTCQSLSHPYGDQEKGQCVEVCQGSWGYDDDGDGIGICVKRCPLTQNLWGDNTTSKCQLKCSQGTFAVNYTDPLDSFTYGICQTTCPQDEYSVIQELICVTSCYDGLFANNETYTCVLTPQECPQGTFASPTYSSCILPSTCPSVSGIQHLADNTTRMCVQQCPQNNQTFNNWGHIDEKMCVRQCPENTFGSNTTGLCSLQCRPSISDPFNGYADPQLRVCVSVCSGEPLETFGDDATEKCVEAHGCPLGTWADPDTRKCQSQCTGTRFADDISKRCVEKCSDYFFGDIYRKKCFDQCPITTEPTPRIQFKNIETQLCTTECPSPTFGNPLNFQCTAICSEGYFAQQSPERLCVQVCPSGTWGNSINRQCIPTPSSCPSPPSSPPTFAYTPTHLCVSSCPSPTYAQNSTRTCQPSCLTGIAFEGLRLCVDVCPQGSNGGDGFFEDQGVCVTQCVTTGTYRNPVTRSCTLTCPLPLVSDPTTMKCVNKCPTFPINLFALENTCVESCPTNMKKYWEERKCLDECPQGTYEHQGECVEQCGQSGIEGDEHFYADSQTIPWKCVKAQQCSGDQVADEHQGKCVQICSRGMLKHEKKCVHRCPMGFFAETGVCVDECPDGKFADQYLRACVEQCHGSYALESTKTCVKHCGSLFADPILGKCASTCTPPLIQNPSSSSCIAQCPPPTIFSPSDNECVNECPPPTFKSTQSNTCIPSCPQGFFGNSDNRICQQECQHSIYKWKNVENRLCDQNCNDGYYKDNNTLFCVQQCENGYLDVDSQYCVQSCAPKFSLATTKHCVSTCPAPFFQDPTTSTCVLTCPSPQYHSPLPPRSCVSVCPSPTFKDTRTVTCVPHCPLGTFADAVSGYCVTVCPQSNQLYGNQITRTCVQQCPTGWFRDHLTRMCVRKCTGGLYADPYLGQPACVQLCSSGFADPLSQTCVPMCSSPHFAFANATTRECLLKCPSNFVEDRVNRVCVQQCLSIQRPYLDQIQGACVSECSDTLFGFLEIGNQIDGRCVQECPTGTFSSPLDKKCVLRCPPTLYSLSPHCLPLCPWPLLADPSLSACVATCTYNATYQSYGDSATSMCVQQCPQPLYMDPSSKKCQTKCTLPTHFATPERTCSPTCPIGTFAQPKTKSCVSVCGVNDNTFGDEDNRRCVTECPGTMYAHLQSRKCVSQCTQGMYGYDTEKICVEVCPESENLFSNDITKKCQATCSGELYADPITRKCVAVCPETLFGKLPQKRCLSSCTGGQYADPITHLCVNTGQCSESPIQLFSDPSTNRCERSCMPPYFASTITKTCTLNCPSPTFADSQSSICVTQCPPPTFADPSTQRCVPHCPAPSLRENSTRTCTSSPCLQGYAHQWLGYCLQQCPQGMYGQARVCVQVCVGGMYGLDQDRVCVAQCLEQSGTYADDISSKCVKKCPTGTYADDVSRKCVTQCPTPTLSDPSTSTCTSICPSTPPLFGLVSSRQCLQSCPSPTFALNSTRLCVSTCPTEYYGQTRGNRFCKSECEQPYFGDSVNHLCVLQCPLNYFAFNQTRKCLAECPQNSYGDSSKRLCVAKCDSTFFASDQTHMCVSVCDIGYFADPLTGKCVEVCSREPLYFGELSTKSCVTECPSNPPSYGNLQSMQCTIISGLQSGCPSQTFADNTTRLCVSQCPAQTYSDPLTHWCTPICPPPLLASPPSHSCVPLCPSYPPLYGEPYSGKCVEQCLQANATYDGSFADQSTRMCVEVCPEEPDYYADNSSGKCVSKCPVQPLSFADSSTRRCVAECPSTPDLYADMKTLTCVETCPQSDSTFSDPTTRTCTKLCPQGLFGDPSTNRCVSTCPSGSFSDPSSHLCVEQCPKYPSLYGNPLTNSCVTQCPLPLYGDPVTRQCLESCPSPLFSQNLTALCLPSCPPTQINYAQENGRVCIDRCPQIYGTYGDNGTMGCVSKCPRYTYADNVTRMCVSVCNNIPEGGFGDNQTRICVSKCPDNSYADVLSRYCVSICPNDWFALDGQNTCVQTCPDPLFADKTTWRCVEKCPTQHLFFGDSISHECTQLCPLGTYADSYTQRCVVQCPGELYGTFGNQDTRACVHRCPQPLLGSPPTWTCEPICPDPYYPNISLNLCKRCPLQCASCSYPEMCLSCVSGWLRNQNVCVQTCPSPLYGDPLARNCVPPEQCPLPYFALNLTKMCVLQCPQKYYHNEVLRECSLCLPGCQICPNATFCQECNPIEAQFFNNSCYIFCSPLQKYYTETGCVNECPDGFFLDLVTCQPCAEQCRTCSQQAHICDTCANGMYLNGELCVPSCPQNTKPVYEDERLYCKNCSQTDCSIKPLTIEIVSYTQDYQLMIMLTFSEPINLLTSIDKVILIKSKTPLETSSFRTKRLLQETAQMNYTIYDYSPSFIFALENQSLPLDLQIQISQPQSVSTPNGQYPQSTRYQLFIPIDKYYFVEHGNYQFIGFFHFLAIFMAVFLIIALIFGEQTLWVYMVMPFQVMFALIVTSTQLPPNLGYVLNYCKYSFLQFLPNMFDFGKSWYNKQINSTFYNFIGDGIFLRSMGFLYSVLVAYVAIVLILVILWKKSKNQKISSFCEKYVKETIWVRDIPGMVHLFFLPTFLLAFMSFRNFKNDTDLQNFSTFSAIAFMLSMLIAIGYYIYSLYSFFKNNRIMGIMLQRSYEYINKLPLTPLHNTTFHFSYSNTQVSLHSLPHPSPFPPLPLLTLLSPPKLSAPFVQHLHHFLQALALVSGYGNTGGQLGALLAINVLYLVYLLKYKPYLNLRLWGAYPINPNIVHALNIVGVSFVAIVMLVLEFAQLDLQGKVIVANVAAGIVTFISVANIALFLYISVMWFQRYIYIPFTESQLFKQNFISKFWSLQEQNRKVYQKERQAFGKRQQFLDYIRIQPHYDGFESMLKLQSGPSKGLKTGKKLRLRPSKAKNSEKQLEQTLNMFKQQHQKSPRSFLNSQRLSKKQRSQVIKKIFQQKDFKLPESPHPPSPSSSSSSDQSTEYQYEYQYVEEFYPQGTRLQDILRGAKTYQQ